MSQKQPPFSGLDAAVIAVGTYVQVMLLRVATGEYPPAWGYAVAVALTVAAWRVGVVLARRQASR